MKYFILIPDGMADEPVPALGGMTPMQAAATPAADSLASSAVIGTVLNVPAGMTPESDTANLSVLSYDPRVYSRGRSPLEAVSMGIGMSGEDTAYRCNLVTLESGSGCDYDQMIITDHSADEISTDEARILIAELDAALGTPERRFYTGISYRHCLINSGGGDCGADLARPHDIIGKTISDYLPPRDSFCYDLMRGSFAVLDGHPLNAARRAAGLRPANSAWFWSPGRKPELPSFREKWGLSAVMISAVDLMRGIGICAGMHSADVPGATGNFHTNYAGKARAAIDAFRGGADLVYLHVEAPDECGHRGELENKVKSIELIDEKILAPVLEYLRKSGGDFKIMILPDHPTPLRLRTHTSEPVPFLIYSSKGSPGRLSADRFDEINASGRGNFIPDGTGLMGILTGD